MANSIKPLITFLLAIAALLFIYSIFQAGLYTLHDKTQSFIQFLSSSAIIIGGVLSTNLGAVLGITLSPPHAAPTAALIKHHPKFLGLRSSINQNINLTAAPNPQGSTTDNYQKLQIIACWLYVIGLVIATVFMLIASSQGKKDTEMVPLITELSKTLLGVLAGSITVALGRTQS